MSNLENVPYLTNATKTFSTFRRYIVFHNKSNPDRRMSTKVLTTTQNRITEEKDSGF